MLFRSPQPLIDYLGRWTIQDKDEQIWITGICREFLGALISADPSHNKPVWEGLAKVEDEETFMTFMTHLIGWMWI